MMASKQCNASAVYIHAAPISLGSILSHEFKLKVINSIEITSSTPFHIYLTYVMPMIDFSMCHYHSDLIYVFNLIKITNLEHLRIYLNEAKYQYLLFPPMPKDLFLHI